MGSRSPVLLVGIALVAVFAAAQVAVAARPTQAALQAVKSRALSASRWSIVLPPTSSNGGSLRGVSCVSSSDCTAVGSSTEGTLVEDWDGVVWSTTSSPSPIRGGSGPDSSWLQAVSCVSATDCIAVGADGDNYIAHTLAERWNGTRWSVTHMPGPAGDSELSGVSCASATACIAVGFAGNYSTLVERWNGSKWSVTHSANPSGEDPTLDGVSCVSASDCTAVGSYFPGVGNDVDTLVEHWNGAVWSIIPSPNPAGGGADQPELSGVSCVSANDCTAVGAVGIDTTSTLVEHWNGSEWSVVPSPNTARGSSLRGVSCVSVKECTAVGFTGSQNDYTLVEHWNGSKWSIIHSPNRDHGTSPTNILSAVSCVSARRCTAVGIGDGSLVEQTGS